MFTFTVFGSTISLSNQSLYCLGTGLLMGAAMGIGGKMLIDNHKMRKEQECLLRIKEEELAELKKKNAMNSLMSGNILEEPVMLPVAEQDKTVEAADEYMTATYGYAGDDENEAERKGIEEISQEEFEDSKYDKVYLEYYKENGIMVDEGGAIDNITMIVGTAWVDGLTRNKTKEVFVRNNKLQTDFSITFVDKAYKDADDEV